ncbi:hypothetical protein TRIATDRAFT_255312 [Trichoderma atroviride IMI 206040]|uniref:Uncharacterized protein n=1 Tax=Hypocrea atroviridis (strain ATCC 20476 / IMI 206040) TaxID=452589 RepID=G9NKN4_HYPAI|nr:uncharacterized protein TRIATDRAFT_255312 [Trichoderma atroviride IMI 206040]EHK48458.1 hypothetical protein TRIATDRAFT_255312 [Trichoderma atroviride IMI 206040]
MPPGIRRWPRYLARHTPPAGPGLYTTSAPVPACHPQRRPRIPACYRESQRWRRAWSIHPSSPSH